METIQKKKDLKKHEPKVIPKINEIKADQKRNKNYKEENEYQIHEFLQEDFGLDEDELGESIIQLNTDINLGSEPVFRINNDAVERKEEQKPSDENNNKYDPLNEIPRAILYGYPSLSDDLDLPSHSTVKRIKAINLSKANSVIQKGSFA